MNTYDKFISQLISGRCASCIHWRGNKNLFYEQLTKSIQDNTLEIFFNREKSQCTWGFCDALDYIRICLDNPMLDGIFGCILYENELK